MLQNAYFLAKIGADTAENEQHFAVASCNGSEGGALASCYVMQELQTAMDRHPPRPDAERGAVLAANGWLH